MQIVPLQALVNQELQILLDGQQYDLLIRSIPQGNLIMDVTMNSVTVITSMPCQTGFLIIPYRYLEGAGGNFVFSTSDGSDPTTDTVGTTATLFYISNAELAAIRG